MHDLLGDPDALARAAGIVDPGALKQARQAMSRVQDAEEALRRAQRERDEAVRAAAAANPDASAGTIARELELKVSSVRTILRALSR